MGWTFYSANHSPKTRDEEKREITRIMWWQSADGCGELLGASKVGNVWYCAVKATHSDPEYRRPYLAAEDGSITFGAVVLTERSGGEWGYKTMTEGCGPVASDCPKKVLALLSSLDPAQAGADADTIRRWRDKCRAAA